MIIMSVDLGKARTGIAVCDKTEFLASPYKVIYEKSPLKLPEKVAEAAKETKAELIVVGLPITAHNFLNNTNTRGKKRKNVVDEVAATIILQNYLDKRAINKIDN